MEFLFAIAPWLIVGLCIVGEAFFAAAELSIVSSNRIRLEEAARNGSAAAKRVLWFRDHPDRLFGTTLLGTNLSTVTGSTVASLTLLQIDAERGEWWAMLLMAPLVLIVGEIIPKSLGQARALRLSQLLSAPLFVIHRLLSPLIIFVRAYTTFLYRALGIKKGGEDAIVSREELVLLMQVRDEPGEIEDEERAMISRIFAFSELSARDSLVPLAEMVAIGHDSTVDEAVQMIARHGFSRLPVFKERIDNVVGILHHLDLLTATHSDLPVVQLMRPAYFVPETQEIDELLVVLKREAASAAIVVDEFGGAVGLITLEDIIEEIVGEIHDEYDSQTGLWRAVADGIIIDARASIDQVNRSLNIGLPESPAYETIAGFILARLKHIPRIGEVVPIDEDSRLTVVQASPRAIQQVKYQSSKTPIEQ
ncbi:MAG: hemolysin family protein [Myxococcota bacterium]|nr:hemolysin family protein [Myxococcota bacterium]